MQTTKIESGVTYNFGASFSAVEPGTGFRCDLAVFSPASTAYASIFGTLATARQWETYATSITTASDATGAEIVCEISGSSVDKIFLTPAPGLY
jgi:hypothetical protein